MDLVDLPEMKNLQTGEVLDYAIVIVCCFGGYILVILYLKHGFDSNQAAQIFLNRCVRLVGP